MTMKSLFLTLLTLAILAFAFSQTTQNSSTSTAGPTTPSSSSTTPKSSQPTGSTSRIPSSTTPLTPQDECPKHNTSCDDCIKAANYQCVFCYGDEGNTCFAYPLGDILPTKHCALSKARWGVCWVNFEALIIAMSVIGGVIILSITVCCIRCCCCRGGDSRKYLKDEAKWERQKAERKQRSEERRADRKERMDEIRRKYGLVKDDTPYQRFDA